MQVISCYIREQQRYTKNQLRTRFSYDDAGVEKFIKILKSYGVLKIVSNTTEKKELTDLVDEDIQVTNETAITDNCYYVFTYVGVITYGNRVIKVYPKYILSETELLFKMKQVIKVIERYNKHSEQIVNLFNCDGDNSRFNILPVILYLLNDYFEYGIYNNTADILEVNGEGDISWNRTINDGFAIIKDGNPYYTELITHRSVEDETDYIKRLHECILTECSKQLHNAELEELFEIETLTLSEESLEDFGEKEYILERIMKELNVQFNTHWQILLKTLYTYIVQDRKMLEEEQGISMFGTTAFHTVWEKTCVEVFGNMLRKPIDQLKIKAKIKDSYNKKTKLIKLVEKPQWSGADFVQEANETLEPDCITINQHAGQDWFIIFDAKYYLIQLEKDRPLKNNPGVEDIVKQYMYQLAYKKFMADHQIEVVKNCFLMPTEGKEIVSKGKAKMDMFSDLGLEDIQIRLIPADMLFDCYLNHKTIEIDKLEL